MNHYLSTRIAARILLVVSCLCPIQAFSQVSCQMMETTCTDPTPCKMVNGVNVCLSWVKPLPAGALQIPQACWVATGSYQCVDSANVTTDTCTALSSNPNCGVIGSKCVSYDTGGNCLTYNYTYQCTQGGGVTYNTDCSGQIFCSDGACFAKKDQPNNALVKVVTAQEVARQAGYYANGVDPNTLQVFQGDQANCSINTLGLANCCKPNAQGANFTDGLIAQQLIQVGWNQLVPYIGSVVGSSYTFDTLFDQAAHFLNSEFNGIQQSVSVITGYNPATNPSTTGIVSTVTSLGGQLGGMIGQQLATSLFCNNCSATAQGIVGAFGYAGGTWAGTWAGGAMTGFMGNTAITSGNTAVANMCMPCLSISVSIMIVMALLACDKNEAMTQLKLGANICHYVGTYCSDNIPFFGCLTAENSYCCYNSKLAQIVNEQGRPQIGKSWGAAEAPDCSGFTVSQVQQLDFTKMDFSAFYADVKAKAMPDSTSLSAYAANSINNFYNQTGRNVTSTDGVISKTPGTQVTANINATNPPIPAMPTCTTTVTKQAPVQSGDQSGSITVTSCQPSGSASFKYSGDCTTLAGTGSSITLDTTGAGLWVVTVPAACAMNTNAWDIFVTDSGNNLLGKVGVKW